MTLTCVEQCGGLLENKCSLSSVVVEVVNFYFIVILFIYLSEMSVKTLLFLYEVTLLF
jgi:hypothetical protein